jgi:beta-lactamase class A
MNASGRTAVVGCLVALIGWSITGLFAGERPLPQGADSRTLEARLSARVGRADGTIGVAVRNLATGETVAVNGGTRFPMQSVFKFPLAISVLRRVDRGELALNRIVHIRRAELLPDTWSPLRDDHPQGDVDVPLAELLRYVVSSSDNSGCDVLFRLLGGPASVERDIRGLGITDIAIVATEEEMHRDWQVQFRNWATPVALVDLLERYDRTPVLSDASRAFLWRLMVETTTGPKRLKGALPPAVVVGHKTGSSGKNAQGVSAAVNDVGILVLPDGRRIAIAVFVTNAKVPDEESEKVMAELARTVAEWYLAPHQP